MAKRESVCVSFLHNTDKETLVKKQGVWFEMKCRFSRVAQRWAIDRRRPAYIGIVVDGPAVSSVHIRDVRCGNNGAILQQIGTSMGG